MDRPNIVLIVSDQHSHHAMGALGNPVVQTPNLDRLAAQGVLFDNCYCNSPICGPSRWSLLTGQLPHAHGGYDNGSTLSSEEPTFAHVLTAAGYETVLCARMHIHGTDQYHGFEKRLATERNNPIDYPPDCLGTGRVAEPVWGGIKEDAGCESYAPCEDDWFAHDDYVLDKACTYLREKAWGERPFLLVASFIAPHPSVQRRPSYGDFYRQYLHMDLGAEELSRDTFENLHPHIKRMISKGAGEARPLSRAENHRLLAEYYSRITYFDSQVGVLLRTLDEEGLRDDTVVIYLSDHGEDMGRHGYWGKTSCYESVAKVPLMVSLPGTTGASGLRRETVSLVDVFPTLCALAGVERPPYPLAGNDLLPLVRGEEIDWPDTAISEYFGGYARGAMFMIRQGPWKLNTYVGEAPELYHLETDPEETRNLALAPDCRQTRRELEDCLRRIVDPEAAQKQALCSQAKRQLIAEATHASVQTKQRLKSYIQEYRDRWDEPTWDNNVRQGQYESHLSA